ncbi:GDSL-type esterase/lipase family protein [Mycetocola zhadangensis]|uniref:GDSL-type esterase/lipase family protein n=1 Tax=Mycetocola zhadangensis TaxID=1164595 RepID=UPI003A4E46F5
MNPLTRFIEKRFMAPTRSMKASQFEELQPSGGEVVLLGDSITAGGAWHEWFPDARVLNRGIDGDTTDGILARLSTVLRGDPSKVFLLIGTNDLALKRPREEIAANVGEIVRRIRAGGEGPELVVQSVMPRHEKFSTRIRDLNQEYELLVARFDAQYLDLWPALSDDQSSLKPEFTLDDLHLTGAGYRTWANVLEPHVTVSKGQVS